MGKMGLSLVNLCDVEADTPTDQYLLYWDSAASKWKCKALSDSDIPAAIARDAEVTSAIAIHAALPDAHHARLVATAGQYVGNGTANRAVVHGLSAIPRIVFLINITNPWYFNRIFGGYDLIYFVSAAPSMGSLAVTRPDITNFYVGNLDNVWNSANSNLESYAWVAIG